MYFSTFQGDIALLFAVICIPGFTVLLSIAKKKLPRRGSQFQIRKKIFILKLQQELHL